MGAAHTAEKVHCKILEKCPQLMQWGLGIILFFYGLIFLKTLTVLNLPSCLGQLFFEEGCNVLITFQYFSYVVAAEKADIKVSESPKTSL